MIQPFPINPSNLLVKKYREGEKQLAHLLIVMFSAVGLSFSQTTEFTYQGRLTDSSVAANGQYDFRFKLFDAQSGGTQQGSTQTVTGVQVVNGIFTVVLNFGASCVFCRCRPLAGDKRQEADGFDIHDACTKAKARRLGIS
ncbi:MAG: hypothetical protein KatS3mg006_0418 [Pyrinomonadaceae bacterium]|nr:MAG: hypothetical protein KatS3mg006_0418 [Pyrinomonadaceae bacterium]